MLNWLKSINMYRLISIDNVIEFFKEMKINAMMEYTELRLY